MRNLAFESLPSTNAYAKEKIESLRHGDIILAKTQTAGRGRNKRQWLSEKGGLYFSLILKDNLQDKNKLSSFTQAMALAVCQTIKQQGLPCYLKWPNDVLLSGGKFCGILSEVIFDDETTKALILGVGINNKQPQVNSDKPAATLLGAGLEIENEKLLELILKSFEIFKTALIQNGFAALADSYKSNFPYLGKEIKINTQFGQIYGVAQDIDSQGRLVIKTQDGLQTISIGDMDF
ncbi:MAG: biotin--[acetyl-CoA-carboxylase] ligase [Elusimicrobiota bacterium]|jgi:BirA family biotin operon repressor/biotin-[acetyl-CoA-carboxylase] ligase|nr:biotin--[acetyl-CoA-carboxylase] ligase [Elusimicrobiota bacterium]